MLRLHRVIENKNEEVNPLLSTDTIQSIKAPPTNWVELDLSGMDIGISQFKSGINKGVYIHKDDLEFLRDSQTNTVNYAEIIDHSYGNSFQNSLTYKPTLGFTKRVSIPRSIIRKLLSYKYLSGVDSKIEGLGLIDWSVYSTGHLGSRSIRMPKRVYEKVSTDQFSEYESFYYSLRDLPLKQPIYKKEEFLISEDQLLQLLKVFFNEPKWDNRRDKDIAKDIKEKLNSCLDTEVVSSLDELKEVFTLDELTLDVFSKYPNIKVYKYRFNIYTISDYTSFVQNIMGGSSSIKTTIDHTSMNRVGNDLVYIIDTRFNAPHVVSYLTKDNGVVVNSSAYREDGRPHTINWSNGKIISVN